MTTERMARDLEKAVRARPAAQVATKYATFDALLDMGDRSLLVHSRDGEIRIREHSGGDATWDFAVRGSPDAWNALRQAPTPTTNHPLSMAFQHLMSLTGGTPRYFQLEGDDRKMFANLPALCAVLEELRHVEA